jgi:hypothetical protein
MRSGEEEEVHPLPAAAFSDSAYEAALLEEMNQ